MKNEKEALLDRLMISCDWGTSSFRLRLVEITSRLVLKEITSDNGIAKIYRDWQTNCQSQKAARTDFYLNQFHQYVESIIKGVTTPLSEIPIIISGMACSSIGMKELPYASMPFYMSGSNAFSERLGENDFRMDIKLISGVSNGKDVMRGEETQLIGLSQFKSEFEWGDSLICIFPGTHSKHIHLENGKMIDFTTFMTGELFDILIHYSILGNAVSCNNTQEPLNKAQLDAFCRGVRQSGKSNLLHSLFSVRTNQLMKYLEEEPNYFYLSGLLIGTELRSLPEDPGVHIRLCSDGKVHALYREALAELGMFQRTSFITPEMMDKAIVEGHIKLMDIPKLII